MSVEKEDSRYVSNSTIIEEVIPKSYAIITVDGKRSNALSKRQCKEDAQKTLYLNRI